MSAAWDRHGSMPDGRVNTSVRQSLWHDCNTSLGSQTVFQPSWSEMPHLFRLANLNIRTYVTILRHNFTTNSTASNSGRFVKRKNSKQNCFVVKNLNTKIELLTFSRLNYWVNEFLRTFFSKQPVFVVVWSFFYKHGFVGHLERGYCGHRYIEGGRLAEQFSA